MQAANQTQQPKQKQQQAQKSSKAWDESRSLKVRESVRRYCGSELGMEAVWQELEAQMRQRMVLEGTRIDNAKTAGRFLQARYLGSKREEFVVLFLNHEHRVIAAETLFQGSVGTAEIHPRVVAQRALALNASALIVSHNHPSGNTKPSDADIATTQRLVSAMDLLDIRVLDHVVVAGDAVVSMCELGLM
jgi:DNA repair protein RadC